MRVHPLRIVGWLLYAALAGCLVFIAVRYLGDVGELLTYRYELDYGEGIVWQQALLMTSPAAYGDITRYPFIVFHYPPLYHLAARGVAALGVDGLSAGRLVSLTATGAVLMSLGALAWIATPARLGRWPAFAAAFVAATLPLSLQPISGWAPLMRVDMLAMALSYAGMLLVALASSRRLLLSVGGLLFAAAIFTKQTAIAAPAATFGVLLIAMPGAALRGALPAAAVAITALASLTWLTDDGFLRHIVSYNVNRFSLWRGVQLAGISVLVFAGLVLVGLAGAVIGGREILGRSAVVQRIRTCRSSRITAIMIVHVAILTAMLPMMGKSGAAINYLIEWCCTLSLLSAVFIGRSLAGLRVSAAERPHLALLFGPAMLLIQCFNAAPAGSLFEMRTSRAARLERIEAEIRSDGRPAISDEMVLLIRAGVGVVWESAIFAELASLGRWDESAFVAMLDRKAFSMVITDGGPGVSPYDSHYTPIVSAAILRNYPSEEMIGRLVVRRPPMAD